MTIGYVWNRTGVDQTVSDVNAELAAHISWPKRYAVSDMQIGHRTMQAEDHPDDLDLWRDLRQEVAEGLLYTHSRLNANTPQTPEAGSILGALIELLSERDLVGAAHEGVGRN